MTQDKINKAVDIFCNELDETLQSLSHMIGGTEKYKCISESFNKTKQNIKSLLQSDNEGREVYLEYHKSHEESFYHCRECKSVLISLYHRQTRTTINIDYCRNCGQKLIWPDNQKKEE